MDTKKLNELKSYLGVKHSDILFEIDSEPNLQCNNIDSIIYLARENKKLAQYICRISETGESEINSNYMDIESNCIDIQTIAEKVRTAIESLRSWGLEYKKIALKLLTQDTDVALYYVLSEYEEKIQEFVEQKEQNIITRLIGEWDYKIINDSCGSLSNLLSKLKESKILIKKQKMYGDFFRLAIIDSEFVSLIKSKRNYWYGGAKNSCILTIKYKDGFYYLVSADRT